MRRRMALDVVCLALLGVGLAGCRSTGGATPTFARINTPPVPQAAESSEGTIGDAISESVANGSVTDSVVDSTGAAARPAHTSPFSRFISRFGRPKSIPLPRTDLQTAATDPERDPPGDLASAF